jgi:hypothetical protein
MNTVFETVRFVKYIYLMIVFLTALQQFPNISSERLSLQMFQSGG